ncbi:MAG: hypothetical protein K6C13_08035 [Oscillospiraceae bacterium]|nr:hypothetical protein [Oscillospiraceae bacterium]
MDKGLEFFNELLIFFLISYLLFTIALPTVLNIIWFRRVKSGKCKRFGALGIITIIVTLGSVLNLPRIFTMIFEFFGWK